jgi:hypothetical protein
MKTSQVDRMCGRIEWIDFSSEGSSPGSGATISALTNALRLDIRTLLDRIATTGIPVKVATPGRMRAS